MSEGVTESDHGSQRPGFIKNPVLRLGFKKTKRTFLKGPFSQPGFFAIKSSPKP